MGDETLFVVVGIEASSSARDPIVNVCYVDSDLDLATDQSLRFDIGEPGIPFSLLVHCDVVGPVLVRDLIERVGHLPLDEAITHAIYIGEYAPSLARRRGIALRGRDDPRWRYIEECAERLDELMCQVDWDDDE